MRPLLQRTDSEHVQALIRVVIMGFGAAYLTMHAGHEAGSDWARRVISIYFFVSLGIVAWIVKAPGSNVVRRYLAMVLDLTVLSIGMALEGASGAPFFMLYLWVSLGNGFRFGVRPLLWSAVISSMEFSAVVAVSSFWHSILPVSYGLILTLIAIPAYTSSLIRQLIATRAAAEAANHAKSRFLATASHELRTPLHAIIGLSELLQQTALSSEQAQMIQTVRGSGRALLSLVEDVLDISSIQAGRAASETLEFHLYESLAETVAIARTQADRKKLELSLHVDSSVPANLVGDWKHVRQILLNLLTNGIKFTDKGRVSLYVNAMARNKGTVRLSFTVADTGIGIAQEDRERIFETFAQANVSSTRKHGGVGLGLAIVKQLTELLNGRIALESKQDAGSKFMVELPFAIAEGEAETCLAPCILVQSEDPALLRIVSSRFPDLNVVSDIRDLKLPNSEKLVALIDGRHLSPSDLSLTAKEVSKRFQAHPLAMIYVGDAVAAVKTLPPDFASSIVMPLDEESLHASLGIASSLASHHDFSTTSKVLQAFEENEFTSPALEPGNAGGLRVLVVDDSPVNRMVTHKILNSAGYGVVLAADGEAALELLADEEFDLLMLDINMPGTSGTDIIKLYKVMRMGQTMPPLVVFSAEVMDETRRECLDLGVSLFLPKPSEPHYMLKKLAELLPAIDTAAAPQRIIEPVTNIASHPRYVPSLELNVIDRDILQSLLNLDSGPVFLAKLVDEFEQDTETVLHEIDKAVQSRALHEFWDHIHAMRSSAANVGARQIFAACLDINAQGKMSFHARGSEYAARLRYEFTRYQRAINRFLVTQTRPERQPASSNGD